MWKLKFIIKSDKITIFNENDVHERFGGFVSHSQKDFEVLLRLLVNPTKKDALLHLTAGKKLSPLQGICIYNQFNK